MQLLITTYIVIQTYIYKCFLTDVYINLIFKWKTGTTNADIYIWWLMICVRGKLISKALYVKLETKFSSI